MMVINADDWGRSQGETDAALACFRERRISSVSAMVFMEDSERAAEVANDVELPVGLHLNLSQSYARQGTASDAHQRVVRFMRSSKFAVLIYHPGLRSAFRDVFRAQYDEFTRIYRREPSHVDGHQHRHLCANLLIDEVIPRGVRVRRNFSFTAGEKGLINRMYRRMVDRRLARRYRLTDYFFALPDEVAKGRMPQVAELAKRAKVEVMTHPVRPNEFEYLMSDSFCELSRGLEMASYAAV